MGWLRQPLLHFVLLGLLLFFSSQYFEQRARQPIEALEADTVQQLHDDWVRQTGRLPSRQQLQALKQQELENRMLYAEALRRNYHRDDTVVLQRLLRDAEFLGIEGSDEEKIRSALALGVHQSDEVIRRRMIQRIEQAARQRYFSEAEERDLRALYDSEMERWRLPARLAFSHRFYSVDRDGDPARRAAADLARLQATDLSPEQITSLGDPFLHGREFRNQSLQDLTFLFGAQFSDALRVREIDTGIWFGPIPSAYGEHLIRIDAITPERTQSYADVRPQLQALWRERQERESLRRYIDELRERFHIVAEEGPEA